MSTPTFVETHNLVTFLEKPAESAGFEQIIDFLKSKPIHYALKVNPTIYVSCVKQFWATAKVNKDNDQKQIQALVDKTKEIITKDGIRSDLHLDDAEGTVCLFNEEIFEGLARMGAKTTACDEFSSTMASAIICLADNQKFNFSKYIFDYMVKSLEGGVKFYLFPRILQVFLDKQVEGMARHKEMYIISSHTKKIFANIKRIGAGFSGVITPLFNSMMVQATADMGDTPVETHQTPIVTQPSTSKTHKPQNPRKKQRKEAKTSHDELEDEDHVLTPSSDPLSSGEDSSILNEFMVFYTSLQEHVLDLQEAKAAQAKEIAALKKNGRTNDDEMFRVDDLAGEEVVVETTNGIKDSAASTTDDKGKAKIIEPEVPLKKKDQIRIDKEYARKLQAKEQEAARLSRAQQDEEANNSWDNIQAMMDVDRLLAKRLQAREMEEFSEEGKKTYFKIIRADGNSHVYQTFEKMFKSFNKEYLEVLWAIVKDRFKKEKPVDDMDNILFRTLKTMFEHHVEDTIWKYQQGLAKNGINNEGLAARDEGPGMGVKIHGLDDESHGLDEEGHSVESDGFGLEEEEVVPEGQHRAFPVVRTAVSEPLGLGYGALRRQELSFEEDHVYSTFEVGQGFGFALEPERLERVSASRQPTLAMWKDSKDIMVYIDVLAYPPLTPPAQTPPSPEWSSGLFLISLVPSIIPSPISSPMISLTVPSPIASPLATSTATISVDEDQFIEAWSWRVDTRMTDMSRAGYDDQWLVYDMLLQQTALQQEPQEMEGRVTALEQERDLTEW
nr:hypothetical protein [Tanacetum cinerariifolium]